MNYIVCKLKKPQKTFYDWGMDCASKVPFRDGSCDGHFSPDFASSADSVRFLPEHQVDNCAHYCSKFVDADMFTSSPSPSEIGTGVLCNCYKNNCMQVSSDGSGKYLYKLENCTRSCNPHIFSCFLIIIRFFISHLRRLLFLIQKNHVSDSKRC